ncbi:AAA family ATPase [Stenotrophomonas humi]
MKIKRFVAADMRTAMNLVRKEHGPDAVILSNRRIEEGVEIVAAAHYDETAVQQALEASRPAAPAPSRPRSAAEAIMAAVTRRRTPEPEPVTATTSAVAALARSAVGATGRSIDSSIELAPGSRFAALLKRPSSDAVPLQPQLEAQRFATLPADEPPVVPAFRPAGSAPVNVVPSQLPEAVNERPVERARFFIDPPSHEDAPMAAPALTATPMQETTPFTVAAPAHSVAAEVTRVVAAPAIAPVISNAGNERELNQLRQEVVGMRQMIEREMNRFTDERLRGSAVRGNALDLMEEYGFDAGLSRDVVMQIPVDTDPARARGLMLGLISRKLPVAPTDPIETGGVIALVGPTGAGKTTTIAKLASRFAEAHAARDVALVTTDTQRIGAREQLYGFGRQLGIAVHEANSSTNLNQLLERLTDYKLVLIDTAGLGQRDRALTAQLQWLRAAGQIRTLLVLPANTSFQDMDEVVRRFSAANPQGLVLTKLDETGRFGSALSVAVDHHLPITWVTDGQDVPEDLHRASAANLVLRLEDLRRAADMPCNSELNNAVA